MQQQFKEWLLKQTTRNGNRFSDDPGQVNGFIKDLKETIPSWNIGIRDVFEITDIDHVRSLYQRCGSNGDLKEKSSSVGNHRPKNALKWYAQFLESNISIDSSLNQNPIFTKLIEILREKSSFRLTGDDEQYRKFIKRFPKENLLNLSLEQYALGDGANDSFCWWIERGLESVIGGYRPGTSKGHLVYFLKSGSLYKNRNIEHLSDAEALKEVLKIHSLVANANLDDLRWLDDDKQIQIRAGLSTKLAMGNGRKLRLLSIYHPGQFLPISSSDHIAHFLTHLGIENLPKREHTVARSLLLKDVFLTAKELIPALTPFEFMKTLYGEELGIKPSKEAVDDEEDADDSETNSKKEHSSMSSLNQILYGPPGTGKTFNTVSKAIEILGQSTFADWQDRTPQSVKELKQAFPGQVEFITFHQSFSYEDFVEGIQAKSDNNQISYAVEDGVFKQLCNLASSKVGSSGGKSISVVGGKIWKMSLGNTLQDQDFIYEECLENHYVLLGWGGNVDFSACQNRQQVHEKMSAELQQSLDDNNYAVTSVNVFKNVVQKGDLIVVSDGNSKFRAIAEVTGDYEFLQDDSRSGFKQKRMVRWLKTYSPSLPASRIFDKSLSQMTLYQLKPGTLNLDRLQSLLSEKEDSTHPKRYVLIIDEINRGNISRIFGELITLIEESKRAGHAEAISVQLPYSKEPFSVPNNLYIIGTMNTADRSLALMDTALRRRFDFIEMMPKPEILKSAENSGKAKIDDVDLETLLRVMNLRIEALYDREHTLGHAFLMNLQTLEDLRLAFRNKILPLLEEYFYDDWQKIRLVLGHAADEFYRKQVVNNSLFVGEDAPSDLVKFERQSIDALSADAFQKIYQGIDE